MPKKVERIHVEKKETKRLGLTPPGVVVDFGSMTKLEQLKHHLSQGRIINENDKALLVGFVYSDKRGQVTDSLYYVTGEPVDQDTIEALELVLRSHIGDDEAKIISVSVLENTKEISDPVTAKELGIA